ncbi:unnamed protein product [Chrysodeixis includens]|uniref:Uncharacterized protein n=1 Tax=Chrysodeixis includens TaxID=689277 RepID=A0A9P0BLA3_CHRIL|nr:unnamed protein product [Chrysodeixis includens]
MDDEQATLDSQFFEFAKLMEKTRDGTTINLYRSDYWLRQAKVLDDRKVTMTDTGLAWWKFYEKTEFNYDEWYEMFTDLCYTTGLEHEATELLLINCGLPGTTPVIVPQYRDFFDSYKSKSKMVF